MVGEMRDAETMATAVSAAETGHLVFSTLHTNNAAQAVDRIIDSFDASQQNHFFFQSFSFFSHSFSYKSHLTTFVCKESSLVFVLLYFFSQLCILHIFFLFNACCRTL
jgi:hypothetical protein